MKSRQKRIAETLRIMAGEGQIPAILTERQRMEIAAAVEFIFLQMEKEKWRPIDEARHSTHPIIVGRRGEPLMAMAIFHGQKWRHADSLDPVCFQPNVWQDLPNSASQGES